MTRLTSVYGSFRARVVAARLQDEGFDVELRGSVDNPYALTVGEMARVDLYVPNDQVDDASLVLLATEVDEVDDAFDEDRPPEGFGRRATPRWWIAAAVLFVIAAGPVLALLRWY